MISAHWQAGPNTIAINAAEETDIIYDFYGFPKHYYEIQYPNKGSTELANKVANLLGDRGIKVEKVKRGLDHGVWVGFTAGQSPLQRTPGHFVHTSACKPSTRRKIH